jgi:hypothetical protein
MVGAKKMPHVPTFFMLDLAWSFVRRFARNLQTGKQAQQSSWMDNLS